MDSKVSLKKMVKIKSYEGKEKNVDCIGCALQRGEIGTSSGVIYEGKHFEVRQDYELPIAGFFIIASKRHIVGFADFNEKEQKEFIEILFKLRKVMRDKLGIKYIRLFMKEKTIESKKSPSHFHLGLLLEHKWMKEFRSSREIIDHAKENRKTKKNIKIVKKYANKAKKYMNK